MPLIPDQAEKTRGGRRLRQTYGTERKRRVGIKKENERRGRTRSQTERYKETSVHA